VRVLSLGIPLPDPQVDNYDWARALSFFDYDALVVDPAVAVSEMVEGVVRDGASFTSYDEEPVQNGPTTAEAIGLADLLKRRRDETERLLARGRLVVCFAYPDVPHPRVAGFTGCHRYYWLPAPAGASYGPDYLKPGGGVEAQVCDYEHPFADFLERHRSLFHYRAVFAEGAAGFGAAARVIARSPGGAAVAVDLAVAGGRIVFLPALPARLNTADRTSLASGLVTAVRNLLLLSSEGPSPAWVSSYDLPGLQEAQERVDRAEAKLEALEVELDEARNAYREVDRYRRMLWQEGKYGLDLPVRDALSLLGMTNFAKPDEPATFSFGDQRVAVETEGSVGAVGMAPHYRLRQRIDREIEERGEAPKGLIIVNGYRETPPPDRPQQYQDSLKVAAESMRYCVLEAVKLFEAVRARMTGDDAGVKAFLESLMQTEGIFEGPPSAGVEPAAVPEAAEAVEAHED
jgi:hypothetical protein